MTREHVFPTWTAKHIKGVGDWTLRSIRDDGSTDVRPVGGPDAKAKILCDPCREVFNRLESWAQDFMPPLFEDIGYKAVFNPWFQGHLATWCAKTALFFEFVDSQPIVPLAGRKALLDTRAPTDSTRVWVAQSEDADSGYQAWRRQTSITFADRPGVALYLGHFQIGHFVWRTLVNAGATPFAHDFDDPEFIQVWPIFTEALTWPPGVRFNDQSLIEAATAELGFI